MPSSKYRAIQVEVDGHRFHSKREAARYKVLKAREEAGEIADLALQPRYPVIVEGEKIGTYVADFRYTENGAVVVEDVKGCRTPSYLWKKKLIKALYGIEIVET